MWTNSQLLKKNNNVPTSVRILDLCTTFVCTPNHQMEISCIFCRRFWKFKRNEWINYVKHTPLKLCFTTKSSVSLIIVKKCIVTSYNSCSPRRIFLKYEPERDIPRLGICFSVTLILFIFIDGFYWLLNIFVPYIYILLLYTILRWHPYIDLPTRMTYWYHVNSLWYLYV